MEAKEYFELYQPKLDKYGKVSKIYDYYDLIDFTQQYHDYEVSKPAIFIKVTE